uniref:Uncharacterized protein n=1 Tax=Magallana gigas TaxID=29159 RepID=K1PK61_MAGGI
MDFLADSQQSQELFDPVGSQESAEPLPPLTVTAPTPAMFQAQVKEQKALKEEVKKLTGQGQQKNVSKNISIEGSPIEREYVIWLKEKFSVNPWISFQEPEVQEKLGELARKAGWPGQAMGVMSSFGSTKFTYYRNQIRSKLMGNKEVDVEGLSIKSLNNYLWKCFLPASTSLANPNREHLTLMLAEVVCPVGDARKPAL